MIVATTQTSAPAATAFQARPHASRAGRACRRCAPGSSGALAGGRRDRPRHGAGERLVQDPMHGRRGRRRLVRGAGGSGCDRSRHGHPGMLPEMLAAGLARLPAQEPLDLGGELVAARDLLLGRLLEPVEDLADVVVGLDRRVEPQTLRLGLVLERARARARPRGAARGGAAATRSRPRTVRRRSAAPARRTRRSGTPISLTGSSIEDNAALGTRKSPWRALGLGLVQQSVARGVREDGHRAGVRHGRRESRRGSPTARRRRADRTRRSPSPSSFQRKSGSGPCRTSRSRPPIDRWSIGSDGQSSRCSVPSTMSRVGRRRSVVEQDVVVERARPGCRRRRGTPPPTLEAPAASTQPSNATTSTGATRSAGSSPMRSRVMPAA